MTQLKIADASMPHQKLVPVRIRGVPICECAGIQKNSHMGSPCTHNEIVRISMGINMGVIHHQFDKPKPNTLKVG